MTDTQHTLALKRLGHIADIGFSIVTETASAGVELLTSNHSPAWTVDQVREWNTADHGILHWMAENLGVIPVSEIGDNDPLATGLSDGHTTLISEFCDGARIGIVLTHKAETLEEAQLDEARASALALLMLQPNQNEFGISAKELIYLKQVSAGATDDEIAAELQLSLRAVKERKRKSIDDLGAKNIGHAVGIAKRADLI